MNKVVEFSGLNFASPDSVCKDGDAAMLINLRKKDGVLQLVPRPTITENVFNTRYTRRVFAHKVGTRTNYIAYQGLQSTLITAFIPTAFDADGEGIAFKEQIISENVTLNDFSVLANKVVLVTTDGLRFATFENDNYILSDIHLSAPEKWPLIHFFTFEDVQKEYTPEGGIQIFLSQPLTPPDDGWKVNTRYGFEFDKKGQEAAQFSNAIINTFYKIPQAEARKEGGLSGVILIRYAIKLIDGSYIQHSPPILLLPSRGSGETFECPYARTRSVPAPKNMTIDKFSFAAYGDEPGPYNDEFSYIHASQIRVFADYDLSAWKDVIESIDVFISPEIPFIKDEAILTRYEVQWKIEPDHDDTFAAYFIPNLTDLQYTTEELREKIIATDTFYKVRSLPLKYSAGENGEILDLTNVLSNLEQQPALPADELTHHSITGTTALMYNKRLHLGGITRHLAAPFPFEFFKVYAQGAQYVGPDREDYFGKTYYFPYPPTAEKYRMQVTISTPEGVKYTDFTPSDDNVRFSLYSPYISYPDNRATAITVYFENKGMQPDAPALRYAGTIPLVPHPSLNLAYYLHPFLEPFMKVTPAFDVQETPPPTPTPQDTDLTVVRVSEVGNPYYFPAENTYSFGAPIVAMAPNTAPLSTGQFGQHPLYIFTEDGIYALGTGNGAITYANVVPVSRDICTNKRLLQTDDSIVFISSQGLMSIRGSVVTHLSADIEGDIAPKLAPTSKFFDTFPRYEPLVGNYGGAFRDMQDFRFYLSYHPEGVSLGFDYTEREIYVNNKQLPYTYVYNIKSNAWHAITLGYHSPHLEGIEGFIENTYSSLRGYGDHGLMNFSRRNLTELVSAFVLTRPIKMDTFSLKDWRRGALRCLLAQATFAHFYMLGSNDTRTWKGLAAATRAEGTYADLVTQRAGGNASEYKYLMLFCMFRGMPGSSISLAELEVVSRFTTKLR
jgi:hypothetical protein